MSLKSCISTSSSAPRARGPLFHTAVADPRGDQLLPLAMLRERYPDLHARHIAKYTGREHRLRERVIPLGCEWADVVFLSPLNPIVLFDAALFDAALSNTALSNTAPSNTAPSNTARSAGRRVWDGRVWDGRVWDGRVWTLDAAELDPEQCCIRLMRVTPGARTADPGTEDDYLPLTTATLRAVSEVSNRALERLRNLGSDEPLLPWGDVPHVLHRGPVPLTLFRKLPTG